MFFVRDSVNISCLQLESIRIRLLGHVRMDLLDIVTGLLTVAVVVAAFLFPINRDHGDHDDRDDRDD